MAEWASIDCETRSTVDLLKAGVYPYAESPHTDVWVVCWALDDGPIETWYPGDPLPQPLVDHIQSDGKLRAWNASFERQIFSHILAIRHDWPGIFAEQWWCTAAQGAAMALPRKLENAAAAIRCPQQKDKEGHALMMRMCRPRRIEEDGTIVWWFTDDRAKQQRLAQYCAQDVRTERAMAKMLRPLSTTERQSYLLDQRINDRGIHLDLQLVHAAKNLVEPATRQLNNRLKQLTRGCVGKATQTGKLVDWLNSQAVDTNSVGKKSVAKLLSLDELAAKVREVLEIRKETAKASTAKLASMLKVVCADGRMRGLLLWHGAGTGRWAGKLVQTQNFPRGKPGAELAIPFILDGDMDILEALFGAVLEIISANLRACMTAAPRHDLVVADYSNIEGRMTAFLAGEAWKLQAFRDFDAGTGPDLYRLAYSRSFGVPIEDVDDELRQVGKVQELALGFQGGINALLNMAAQYSVDLSGTDPKRIVAGWRNAHPATQSFWYRLEAAAMYACRHPGVVAQARSIRFVKKGGFLWMILPSGRPLAYADPVVMPWPKPWGEITDSVVFWTTDSLTKQWVRQAGYGGLWCENAVQAAARDILVNAMPALEAAGYPIVMTSHDEPVCEVLEGYGSVEEVCEIMCRPVSWAEGLPLSAKGWRGKRYKKG